MTIPAHPVTVRKAESPRIEHAGGPAPGGDRYAMDGRLTLNDDSLRTGDAATVRGRRRSSQCRASAGVIRDQA